MDEETILDRARKEPWNYGGALLAMYDALAARLAAMEHGGVCMWCGEGIDLREKSMEEAVEWARAHDASCPDNPLRARLAAAERERDALLTVDPAALRRDAARYRWLRSRCGDQSGLWVRHALHDSDGQFIGCDTPHETELDAVIDAAMERTP